MRSIILLSVAIIFTSLTLNAQDIPSKESVVGINSAFVPGGFDSTSDVYAIVSGIYPNSCYSWKRADVEPTDGQNVIRVSAVASVTQGMCMMVLVPFQREVLIGTLPVGDYTLRFSNGEGTYFDEALSIEQ